MKRAKCNKEYVGLGLIIFASLIVRFWCRDVLSGDMRAFLLPWYDELKNMDLHTALTTQVGNYNLFYQLIIYCMTKLPGGPIYKYKLLSVIFDFVLAFGVYVWLKELTNKKRAFFGFVLTILLPTVWLNSAAWGQCDSIYVSLIIWSLYMLYMKRNIYAFVLLGFSLAFKLQVVFILPFYGYIYLSQLKKREISVLHFLLIPLLHILTALPNLFAGRSIVELFTTYLKQTNRYHKMYMNYPSIWSIISSNYDEDKYWAVLVTLLILCALMFWFYKDRAEIRGKHFLWGAFILSYTCVLFLPAMHERYGFLYEILAVLLVFYVGRGWVLLIALQLVSLKTYIFYLYQQPLNIKLLAFINIMIYVSVLIGFYMELHGKLKPITLFVHNKKEAVIEESPFQVVKQDIMNMIALMLLFLVVGSFRLGAVKAPESFMTVGDREGLNKEIVLSLPDASDISSIEIYLGAKSNRAATFYVEENGKWKEVSETQTLKCVFAWNHVDINERALQINIVFHDEEAMIGELVCTDTKGNVILPVNASEYPELFNEQDCYNNPPTYYYQTMFDEVNYGRTAYEFLHESTIYENTHPPLGKLLISVGIKVFGMNPFGYRIISLIFGTLMIPIIYLFVLRITKKSSFATLSGLLLVTEFMHYTMSRMATIDIIVAFFVLCMFYGIFAFFQEEKRRCLVFSGIFSAFGIATKWTACYALFGIAILIFVWMFQKWKKEGVTKDNCRDWCSFIGICAGCFIVFPVIVYVLSYIPFARAYPENGIIKHAISNSYHMYQYHYRSNITQSSSYASPWYSWPINWVPVVDSYTRIGARTSVVATFINPLVSIGGLIAVVHHIYLAFAKRNRTAKRLLVFYCTMLIPWIFVSRALFIYQYFICTQVLILMFCHSIKCMGFEKEKRIIHIVGGISTSLFIMFFPVISGMEVNRTYVDEILKWLPKWWF